MRRAVTICPGVLFLEFSEVFSCSGKMVPAGITFSANNPVVSASEPASNVVFILLNSSFHWYNETSDFFRVFITPPVPYLPVHILKNL
jgi:hypothetical protein